MFESSEGRLGVPLYSATLRELTLPFQNEFCIGTNLIYLNRKALHCLRRVSVEEWYGMYEDSLDQSCNSGPYLFC